MSERIEATEFNFVDVPPEDTFKPATRLNTTSELVLAQHIALEELEQETNAEQN